MLLYLVLIGVLIALGTGYFFIYFKPKRAIKQFCEKARKAGYKVKVTPYNPLDFFVVNYMKQDNRSLEVFKNQLKQYDLIVGNFFTKLAILPNHPDILKDIFNQSSKVHKNPFFIDVYKLLADGGIPLAEGQSWKRKRKIISSVFHFDFLNHMIPVIEVQTDLQMKKIDQKIKNGEAVNLLHSCSRIFSSVIVKCFFGTDVNEYSVNGQPYCEFYMTLLNQLTDYSQSFQRIAFGMTSYNLGLTKKARELKKNLKITYSIALQVIEKQLVKLKNGEFTEQNLLTTLYKNNMLNQTDVHEPNKYSKDELIGQFFSFFGAGTDTTTNTVNLVLHYLSQKKQYAQKIKQELQELKQLEGQQKLRSMKWTEAVINETLRLGGPAASLLPRVVVEKITAGGLQIPEQTSLSIFSIMNMYKDEYFEKPFEFKPERWIENQNVIPYTYVPFSAGQRNCIGQYLAKIESKILVEKILKKYNFKAKYPIKMQYEFAYATQHGQYQMEIKS